MQIPLVEGRLFNDSDTPTSPPVAIVDQYLVEKYFKGRSAIGQEISRGGPNIRIIGVVAIVNSIDLGQPVTKERIYRPLSQAGNSGMALVIKSGLEPTQLVSQVRGAVQSIDPEQPVATTRTMEEWVDRSLGVRRAPMALLTIFGAVALVLSAIGIYGVLAYGVTQRVREFGIRQALGADQHSILSLVLKQGLTRVALGVSLGLIGAFALSRYLQSMLFGVTARDMPVFAVVTLLLFVVGLLACYVPARRATRIDPMIALRDA